MLKMLLSMDLTKVLTVVLQITSSLIMYGLQTIHQFFMLNVVVSSTLKMTQLHTSRILLMVGLTLMIVAFSLAQLQKIFLLDSVIVHSLLVFQQVMFHLIQLLQTIKEQSLMIKNVHIKRHGTHIIVLQIN